MTNDTNDNEAIKREIKRAQWPAIEDVFVIADDGTENPAPIVSVFIDTNDHNNNNRPRRSSAPSEND